MPNVSCAVVNCTNNSGKLREHKKSICAEHQIPKGECGCPLPFTHYKFPSDPVKLQQWTTAINRKSSVSSNQTWKPPQNAVVCSKHFVDRMPTEANPLPTIDLGYQLHRELPKGRCRNVLQMQKIQEAATLISPEKSPQRDCENWLSLQETEREHVMDDRFGPTYGSNEYGPQSAVLKQLAKVKAQYFKQTMALRAKNKRLLQLTGPINKLLLKTDKDVMFYTGIPTKGLFHSLCKAIHRFSNIRMKPSKTVTLRLRQKYKVLSSSSQGTVENTKLCLADQILMTLMKLRLGLLHKDLADRFKISIKSVTSVYHRNISLLSAALRPLIVFYTRQEVSKTIPPQYGHYKRLRCIIDCTEMFIQKPSNPLCQAATWSDYKHNNTVKLLVAVTPQGSVAFISKLWGGRASDRHIVTKSRFLSYLMPGDQVLADRGFTIREELLVLGAELVMPPAAKGKAQMTAKDVASTKKVANVRIHVERVIQRLKRFRLLSQTIPISLLTTLNDAVVVCCAITNMQGPIVKTWNEVATDDD